VEHVGYLYPALQTTSTFLWIIYLPSKRSTTAWQNVPFTIQHISSHYLHLTAHRHPTRHHTTRGQSTTHLSYYISTGRHCSTATIYLSYGDTTREQYILVLERNSLSPFFNLTTSPSISKLYQRPTNMCSPTRVLIAPMTTKTTPLNLNMVLPWMYGEAGGPMWPKKEWKDMYESVPTGNISGMGSKNTDLRQAKAHALVRSIFRTLSPSPS
jgi:hypothetical protein